MPGGIPCDGDPKPILRHTYGLRGALYGPFVIAYLFLGGTAAGGIFAMAAWSLAVNRPLARAAAPAKPRRGALRPPLRHATARSAAPSGALRNASGVPLRRAQAFEQLQARVYPLCLLLLVLAIAFLFWDLGRPERALLVLLQPHATFITFGAFCLVVETALGALLVLGSLFRLPFLAGRARRAIEVSCCASSLATMAYTGAFLTGNVGIPAWSSPWLIALFTCSSLSCGMALLLLADWFIKDQTLLLRAVRPLQKWHLACLAAEALSIALFLGAAFENPAAGSARALLLSPDMLPTAVVGVLGFGLAAPAALEIYSLARKDCRAIPVSDALCLCGGLILRYCVIACGVH